MMRSVYNTVLRTLTVFKPFIFLSECMMRYWAWLEMHLIVSHENEKRYMLNNYMPCITELIPESSLTSLRIFQTYRIFGEQTCIRECERIGVSVCARVLSDPPPPSLGPSPWQPDYVSCYPIRVRLLCCVPCHCCLLA